MTSVELLLDISNDDMNNIINEYSQNESITQTDREIFYSDIFYKENDRWENKSSIIENFVLADEYVEYLTFLALNNKKTNSKIIEKTILKKKLEYQSVVTDFSSLSPITVRKNRNNFIVNRNSIAVPFQVKAFIDNKEYTISPNTNISIHKFKHRPIYSLDLKNKFRMEINKNLEGISIPRSTNLETDEGTITLISRIAKNMANVDITNKYNMILKDLPVYFLKCSNEYTGEYNKPLMSEFNEFLTFKLFNTNILNMYNSFDIDNKINVLERIMVEGDKALNGRGIIKSLINSKNEEDKYNKAVSVLIKQQSKLSRLEFICKKKFPNLFNKNSKEVIFNSRMKFSLEALPSKYKQALLAEYKLREAYEEKIITSKCGHKQAMKNLKFSETNFNPDTWEQYLKWMNKEPESGFHNCVSCSLPITCEHEYFLYSNYYSEYKKGAKTNDIRKVVSLTRNKFMINGGVKGFAYCKHCGEELSNSKDEENVVGYDDGVNMYSSKERERDQLEVFIYFIVVRNIFISSSNPLILSNVVNTIWKTINPIVSSLKKKKKFKKGDTLENAMDKHMELNITIMTIVSIMVLSLKYSFIGFKQTKKAIIVQRNNKSSVKDKFREAFDVFSNNYSSLIRQTNYIDKMDTLRELFIKVYGLIKDNLEESISISEDNISQFLDENVAEKFLKNNIPGKNTGNRDFTYSIPVVNYIQNINPNVKIGARQGPVKEKNAWMSYKESNYNIFSKFFNDKLYERYHDDRLNKEWDSMVLANRQIENTIKEINILQTLYPYGHIPYSYARYFKGNKWEDDMGLYACAKTGKKHIWGSYLFKNKDKIIEIAIKNVADNLPLIEKSSLHSIKCKECNMDTVELSDVEMGKKTTFESIVETKSDINSFYMVFKYRCLVNNEEVENFHNFIYTKNSEIKCSKCGILFKEIQNKSKEFYEKNTGVYKKYKEDLNSRKNNDIIKVKRETDDILSLDYKKMESVNIKESFIKEVKEKSLLDKMSYLNINNSSILSKTGETESISEDELEELETLESKNKNDIFLKLIDRIREICVVVGILAKSPVKHKYDKDSDFNNLINSISSDVYVKDINDYIINGNFINTCWEYRNINGVQESISFTKSSLYEILIKLKEKTPLVYEYIIQKLKLIDVLYTSFNYAEIKKTFNVNKIIEDDISFSGVENDGEIEDDSELFDSSDLSMNNFEDDDLDNDV